MNRKRWGQTWTVLEVDRLLRLSLILLLFGLLKIFQVKKILNMGVCNWQSAGHMLTPQLQGSGTGSGQPT